MDKVIQHISQLNGSMSIIQQMLNPCIQCGTCTGSCPNEFAMDITPRKLWRMILSEEYQAAFETQTFAMCSSCYLCTLRCPRGIELTDVMSRLKQLASKMRVKTYEPSDLFYRCFTHSIRQYGRVRETELITRYFILRKDPRVPLKFTPLGIKLMQKGKLDFKLPSRGRGRLESLFQKIEEMESGL